MASQYIFKGGHFHSKFKSIFTDALPLAPPLVGTLCQFWFQLFPICFSTNFIRSSYSLDTRTASQQINMRLVDLVTGRRQPQLGLFSLSLEMSMSSASLISFQLFIKYDNVQLCSKKRFWMLVIRFPCYTNLFITTFLITLLDRFTHFYLYENTKFGVQPGCF